MLVVRYSVHTAVQTAFDTLFAVMSRVHAITFDVIGYVYILSLLDQLILIII